MKGDHGSARALLEKVDSVISGTAVVTLTATKGLLHLREGDFYRGEEGYRHAEQLALQQGKNQLARVVRQKMCLELARAYRRVGDIGKAKAEVRKGLLVNHKSFYRRQMEALHEDLNLRTLGLGG